MGEPKITQPPLWNDFFIGNALVEAVAPLADALLADAPCGLVVRSSGLYEDSAAASFAGVYESFLGIVSSDQLWRAVRQCWCAAWAPLALEYTRRMGLEPRPDTMAVLVQRQLPATSAGVLFTADPQTGNPWHFVLESTLGLAQDLVGGTGAVPADRFVLEWHSGKILDKAIVAKSTKWIGTAAGLQNIPLTTMEQSAPSLSDGLAVRIGQQALVLDRFFGGRVDIEWVVADQNIHIVQVRPITALPPFFPCRLSPADDQRRWRPLEYWPFNFAAPDARATPPLYRDIFVSQLQARYWPGAAAGQAYPPFSIERDFNGYRYRAAANSVAPLSEKAYAAVQEAYLDQHETTIRQTFLDAKQHRYPAVLSKASALLQSARSLGQLLEGFFWVRDTFADLHAISAGPAQSLFGTTYNLLRDFLEQQAPDHNIDSLIQGHHPDLEPYYPHAQVAEAKKLARTIEPGPVRRAFETMQPAALITHLFEEHEASPFMTAFADYCSRFGLYMPDHRTGLEAGERHRDALSMVQDVLRDPGEDLAAMQIRAIQRRHACAGEIRQTLKRRAPGCLPRFDKLFDWALFWGPALNDRGWIGLPMQKTYELWWMVRTALVEIGLIDQIADFADFTTEDLIYIAAAENMAEGRTIGQRRRLEREGYERLQAPDYLGAPPATPITPTDAAAQQIAPPDTLTNGQSRCLTGKRSVPGRCRGLAFKIDTLEQGDRAGHEHVLLLCRPLQPNAAKTPLLFSLMLRVQGLAIVEGPMMWMHHVAQIARECGVPIVQLADEQIARIPDGAELSLDGAAGTVTIHT